MNRQTDLLTVSNLSIGFQLEKEKFLAVEDVSFSIKKGESLGIVGESGCGKSVTAMSIIRLLPIPPAYLSGVITFDGTDILKADIEALHKIRGKEIGVVFQEPSTSLNPTKTIGDQISEVFTTHNPELSKEIIKNKAVELLSKVGIPNAQERVGSYPHEFSGGMKQRVSIAIAIALNPKLLIADEPTTALDVTIQAQILDLIKKIQNERKSSVLIITHNMGIVADFCDRIVVMYAGRIVESAKTKDLFSSTSHPYTIGLLNSIPSATSDKKKLYSITGSVPHPKEYRKGCRFFDRCEKRITECESDVPPPLFKVGEGHKAACWLYENTAE